MFPTRAITLTLDVWGDITNVIIHVKFYVYRLREFRVLAPPQFCHSQLTIGWPYNSISVTVLSYCDAVHVYT